MQEGRLVVKTLRIVCRENVHAAFARAGFRAFEGLHCSTPTTGGKER